MRGTTMEFTFTPYDTPITGTLIYNNFFWGDWGNNVTAHVFIEGNSSQQSGQTRPRSCNDCSGLS